MSRDALFQLGMGSIESDATQTEEFFATRALRACMTVFVRVFRSDTYFGLTGFAVANQLCAAKRTRGNSAKALILLPTGPATHPPRA